MSAYEQALRDLEHRLEVIERLEPVHDFAEDLIARYPGRGLRLDIDPTNEAVWIFARCDSLAEVQPLLAEIVRARHRPRGRRDYPDGESPRVMYSFGEAGKELIMNVYLNPKSALCRFEKIGEKTVPVLRIVCEKAEVAG